MKTIFTHPMNALWELVTRDLSIDLGTHMACIGTPSTGAEAETENNGHRNGFELLTAERTVAYVRRKTDQDLRTKLEVVDTGDEAALWLGHNSEDGRAIRCVTDGEINDDVVAEIHLQKLITDSFARAKMSRVGRPRIVMAAPDTHHPTKWIALAAATRSLRPREVHLVTQPVAAAVGIDVIGNKNPKGCLIIDIGGGTAHVFYAASYGVIAPFPAVAGGGDYFNANIEQFFLSREFEDLTDLEEKGGISRPKIKPLRMQVDPQVIETLKLEIGSATMPSDLKDPNSNPFRVIDGYSSIKEEMVKVRASSADLQPYIVQTLNLIAQRVIKLLEHFQETKQPAILSSIAENGIKMVGGGSKLRGCSEYLSSQLQLPVEVMTDPEYAVIRGATKILKDPFLLKKFGKDYTRYAV